MPANKPNYPLLLFLVLAASLALPASAGALVAPTAGGGKLGYLPLNSASAPSGAQSLSVHASEPAGFPPLKYHGGPVMHSQKAFAIFWAAAGHSFPAGYKAAIETYLQDVAADSGKPSNVYSVSAQYTDQTGHATYSDTYGGAVEDPNAYGLTCPPYAGAVSVFTACVSDEKMQEEVASVVESNGWPHGIGAEYYVVLPPEVGSCFKEEVVGPFVCFDEEEGFCAYHSFSEGSELVYANISYSPEDPLGCGVGEYPNGHANGNADDTFSSLSHEANESITDPTLEAWYDEEGFENGDECRGSSDDYGPPLGGSEGAETLFNQEIGAHHYYLQQEWSNDIADCAQRVNPANPVISGPASAAPGQSVTFNGFASSAGSGGIRSESWGFGDGSGANGGEVTHAYSAPGTYTVTLTVTDDGGFAYSTSWQVAVSSPAPAVTVLPPSRHAGLAVAAAKAKVRKGVVALKLTCTGGGPCAGVVKLLDHGVIGHASFRLAAGATKVLKVGLSTGGRALLARRGGGLKVTLSGAGVRHRRVTLVSG